MTTRHSDIDKNEVRLNLRINNAMQQLIKIRSLQEKRTITDIIKSALTNYLTQDIDETSILIAKMNNLKKDNELLRTKVDIFIGLFDYWLVSFFTSSPELPQNEDDKKRIIDVAVLRKNSMITAFQEYFEENPKFFEKMKINLQDYEEIKNEQ